MSEHGRRASSQDASCRREERGKLLFRPWRPSCDLDQRVRSSVLVLAKNTKHLCSVHAPSVAAGWQESLKRPWIRASSCWAVATTSENPMRTALLFLMMMATCLELTNPPPMPSTRPTRSSAATRSSDVMAPHLRRESRLSLYPPRR